MWRGWSGVEICFEQCLLNDPIVRRKEHIHEAPTLPQDTSNIALALDVAVYYQLHGNMFTKPLCLRIYLYITPFKWLQHHRVWKEHTENIFESFIRSIFSDTVCIKTYLQTSVTNLIYTSKEDIFKSLSFDS